MQEESGRPYGITRCPGEATVNNATVGRRRLGNIFFAGDTTVQAVSARLRATGSRDPDVLYAAKTEFGRMFAHQRTGGLVAVIIGLATSVTVVLAVVGIPLACIGAWCWRKGARNLATVDAAYRQFMQTVGCDWAASDARLTGP